VESGREIPVSPMGFGSPVLRGQLERIDHLPISHALLDGWCRWTWTCPGCPAWDPTAESAGTASARTTPTLIAHLSDQSIQGGSGRWSAGQAGMGARWDRCVEKYCASIDGMTDQPIELVITIDEPPGLWDILASFSGVVAVVLALVALWVTRRQRIAAEKAIARERRLVFELEVLRELLDHFERRGESGRRMARTQTVISLVAALPPAELPFVRLHIRESQKVEDPSQELLAAVHARHPTAHLPNDFINLSRRMVADEITKAMQDRATATI